MGRRKPRTIQKTDLSSRIYVPSTRDVMQIKTQTDHVAAWAKKLKKEEKINVSNIEWAYKVNTP